MLYDGQGRFHGSTAATVDYVVRQSGDTVANLQRFTGFLETAKAAGVGPVALPDDVKGRIDDVVRKVGAASDELAARTASIHRTLFRNIACQQASTCAICFCYLTLHFASDTHGHDVVLVVRA